MTLKQEGLTLHICSPMVRLILIPAQRSLSLDCLPAVS